MLVPVKEVQDFTVLVLLCYRLSLNLVTCKRRHDCIFLTCNSRLTLNPYMEEGQDAMVGFLTVVIIVIENQINIFSQISFICLVITLVFLLGKGSALD